VRDEADKAVPVLLHPPPASATARMRCPLGQAGRSGGETGAGIMLRVLLAALCVAFFAAPLQAGGVDDLKAATAATKSGKSDEAITLYTQALAASDLSSADQAAAHKGRGEQYSGKSAVADTFHKRDDAHRLREDAISDFTAAIGLTPGDVSLYTARGQDYQMDGQYDRAIADFDAALKLNNSPIVLVQRASSRVAKGDYDGAVADDTAALALGGKDGGLDGWEIYNERGYAQFLAARYDRAAADFAQALTLGLPSRTEDVLWLPYQATWLHVARARAGQNDAEELARNAEKMNLKQWPGTLVALFLGRAKLDEVMPASSHGMMGHARECSLSFFTGEQALAKGDSAEATRLLLNARDMCNIHTVQYLGAGVELKRMGK